MRTLLIFLLVVPFLSFGQDINGKWEGNYSWAFGMSHPEKLVVDISIYDDSLISGSSHLYYPNGHYEHYTIHVFTVPMIQQSTLLKIVL